MEKQLDTTEMLKDILNSLGFRELIFLGLLLFIIVSMLLLVKTNFYKGLYAMFVSQGKLEKQGDAMIAGEQRKWEILIDQKIMPIMASVGFLFLGISFLTSYRIVFQEWCKEPFVFGFDFSECCGTFGSLIWLLTFIYSRIKQN